jgi:glycosyltransferase involved in cell wall biosynthesis
MKAISVIIPTAGGPQLCRALNSVEHQDFSGPIEVIIVTENAARVHDALRGTLASMRAPCRVVGPRPDGRAIDDNPLLGIYPWAAIAHLRNTGIAAADGALIAHLDEDNEYLPHHLSTLFDLLERSPHVPAAFSWRRLLCEDGTPYTANAYPWVKQPNLAHARYIFDMLVDNGIFHRDCCEMRDQYISSSGEQLLTVDTSEWLIRRDIQLRFPFKERLSFREVSHCATDDYLFCKQMADAGIQAGSSEQVTLNYYLGGRTTTWLIDALRQPKP